MTGKLLTQRQEILSRRLPTIDPNLTLLDAALPFVAARVWIALAVIIQERSPHVASRYPLSIDPALVHILRGYGWLR